MIVDLECILCSAVFYVKRKRRGARKIEFYYLILHLSIFISLSVSFVLFSSQRPALLQRSGKLPFYSECHIINSVIFNVDPDTHIDSIEQAESAVLEGTANWSAKIAVTGT